MIQEVESFNIVVKRIGNNWLAEIPEIDSYGYSEESSAKAIEDLMYFLDIYFENEKRKKELNKINNEIKNQ